jgi:DNA-binding CsgD family transcriptional regulator
LNCRFDGISARKFLDILAYCGEQPEARGLTQAFLESIHTLIPFEINAIAVRGSLETGPRLLDFSAGIRNATDNRWLLMFRESYWKKLPPELIAAFGSQEVVSGETWKRKMPEFNHNFHLPQGIHHSTAMAIPLPRSREIVVISINRSSAEKPLDEKETEILSCFRTHLFNLYKLHDRISRNPSCRMTPDMIREKTKMLSRRESEIASMLYQRLTMPEMASRLLLSVRTVETHVSNIYYKLKVRSRAEMISFFEHP